MRIFLVIVGLLAIFLGFITVLIAKNAMNEVTSVISVMGGFILIGLVMVANAVDHACTRLIAAMGLTEN